MKKLIMIALVFLTACTSTPKNKLQQLQTSLSTVQMDQIIFEAYEDSINPFGGEILYSEQYENSLQYVPTYVEQHYIDYYTENSDPDAFLDCAMELEKEFISGKFNEIIEYIGALDVEKIEKPYNIPYPVVRIKISQETESFIYFYSKDTFMEIKDSEGNSEYYTLSEDDINYIYHYIDDFYVSGFKDRLTQCNYTLH